jgi:two-component system sensor histidine kinase/response regulator
VYIRQWDLALSILSALFILTLAYWFSRVMKKFMVGWVLYLVISYLIFTINYFLNSGINGTTIIMSFVSVAMLYATSSSKNHWIWTSLHGLLFSGLLLYELSFGGTLIEQYESEELRFIHTISSYILSLGFLHMIFRLVRRAYEQQRLKTEEQKALLETGKNELEASNKELAKVLSVIAHDVRNPLASIEGFLELSADDALSKDDRKELQDQLLKMVRNTSHMLDDMLNWSQSQMQGQTTQFKKVALWSWLNPTIAHLKDMAHAKGLQLIENYNGRDQLYCDPNLMTVIIRNLMQNAIKFTPRDGRIYFTVEKNKEGLSFCIEDKGIGMDADTQQKLFSEKQTSTDGTNMEKGNGFGLVIVKEFVELHQGSITVVSKVGLGTTFTVQIPMDNSKS